MPTLERVSAFIAMVEAGDHVAAIEQFYHRDATMQENFGSKREGLEALISGEKAALIRMGGAPESKCLRYAINGDTVMINWTFAMGGQFATPDGKPRLLDEVAVQVWRGDKIATERFYYDPSTLR